MISIPKNLNPSSAFKIVDSRGGYVIYTDAIRNRGEADPEQELLFKNLRNGNYAYASLHAAAWEGEMHCACVGMHQIPSNIKHWLSDQV